MKTEIYTLKEFLTKNDNPTKNNKDSYKFYAISPAISFLVLEAEVIAEWSCVMSCIMRITKILNEGEGTSKERTIKIAKTVVKHGMLFMVIEFSPYVGNLLISMGGLKYAK